MNTVIKKINLILIALVVMFIWGNSLLPASVSSDESEFVKSMLDPLWTLIDSGRIQSGMTALADKLSPGWLQTIAYKFIDWADEHVLSQGSSYLVRKLAHFTEYMVLGVLMCSLLARPNARPRFLWPEILCLAVASIDETIQLFSEGRGAAVRDVMIDLCGATLGVILMSIFLFIVFLSNVVNDWRDRRYY